MSKTKLLPCPFCGGEAEMVVAHHVFEKPCVVICKDKHCGVSKGNFSKTKEEAINAWNNRKPVDDVLERMEMMKEYEKNGDCPKDGMCDHHNCGVCYTNSAIEIVKEVMGYVRCEMDKDRNGRIQR